MRWCEACETALGNSTYTTICLRPSNGLRINLRVRKVTCDSDMTATGPLSESERYVDDCERECRFKSEVRSRLGTAHAVEEILTQHSGGKCAEASDAVLAIFKNTVNEVHQHQTRARIQAAHFTPPQWVVLMSNY